MIRHDGIALLVACSLAALAPAAEGGPSVSGRVLDVPGGKGAAGVVVSLEHGRRERSYTTRTDERGHYSFVNVVPSPDVVYCLSVAERPAGVGMAWVPVMVTVRDVRAEDLYLAMPQSVSGTVRDAETNEPLGDVRVFFEHHERRTGVVRTDARGRYRLYVPPGKVRACCMGTDAYYSPKAGSGKSLHVAAGKPVAAVDFRVVKAPAFTGRVALPDGRPAGDVTVEVVIHWQFEPDLLFPVRAHYGLPWQHLRFKTDAAGRFVGHFRAPRVLSGDQHRKAKLKVRIVAFTADRSMGRAVQINTVTPVATRPPIKLALARAASVTVRFGYADGGPLPELRLQATRVQSTENTYGMMVDKGVTTRHLGEGRYRLTGLIPGTTYSFYLDVDAPGYDWAPPFDALNEKAIVFKPDETRDLGSFTVERYSGKHVRRFVEQLKRDSGRSRTSAAERLGGLGAGAAHALPDLLPALKAEGAAALMRALKEDGVNGVRRAAAEALAKIGDPAATPALLAALSDNSSSVRRSAAAALASPPFRNEPGVVETLIRTMKQDASEHVRAAIPSSLAAMDDPAVVGALKAALADADASVRKAAMAALARPALRRADPSIARLMRLAPLAGDKLALDLAIRATETGMAIVIQEMREGRAPFDKVADVLRLLTGRSFTDREEVLAWWWQFPLDSSPARRADVSAGQLKALWSELAREEGLRAHQAILAMAAGGNRAMAFLAERLKPASADAARIKTLLTQLGSERYAVRREAYEGLSRLGRAAGPALREALRTDLSAEARQRGKELLEACDAAHPALPEARRTARAVRVLELIGTQQSVQIIKRLARGAPMAHATEQARSALRRIRKADKALSRPAQRRDTR